jgi:hypothetical protein
MAFLATRRHTLHPYFAGAILPVKTLACLAAGATGLLAIASMHHSTCGYPLAEANALLAFRTPVELTCRKAQRARHDIRTEETFRAGSRHPFLARAPTPVQPTKQPRPAGFILRGWDADTPLTLLADAQRNTLTDARSIIPALEHLAGIPLLALPVRRALTVGAVGLEEPWMRKTRQRGLALLALLAGALVCLQFQAVLVGENRAQSSLSGVGRAHDSLHPVDSQHDQRCWQENPRQDLLPLARAHSMVPPRPKACGHPNAPNSNGITAPRIFHCLDCTQHGDLIRAPA